MTSAKFVEVTARFEVLGLLTLVVVVHLFGFSMDFPPVVDEVFHLLAARTWAHDGTLGIADGQYTRAWGYTTAIGVLFWTFGENLALARAVSILAGALWVAAVFVWVRDAAGRPAAWIAAVLFALAPTSVIVFHIVRFYTFHGLFFFLGAVGVYALTTGRVALASGAGLLTAFGIALAVVATMHLQIVTVTGLVALAVWVVLERSRQSLLARSWQPIMKWGLTAGLLVAVLLWVSVTYWKPGVGLWEMYRHVSLWNIGNRDQWLYYQNLFDSQYPVLLALLPVAALFALARRPVPALFCICIFGTAVLLHSFAGMKAARYIHFAVPFFFALWGIALAEAVPLVRGVISAALERLYPIDLWPRVHQVIGAACFGAVVVFLIVGTPGLLKTYKMARQWPETPSHPGAVWSKARPFLQPWIDKAAVVLTTNDFHTIYYFGDYNYQISRYRVTETRPEQEFGRDPRSGRASISKPESVALVISCYPSGLFLGDPFQWRNEIMGVSNAVAEIIEAKAQRIDVPAEWDLRVYYWQHAAEPLDAKCAGLPPYAFPSGGKRAVAAGS